MRIKALLKKHSFEKIELQVVSYKKLRSKNINYIKIIQNKDFLNKTRVLFLI